MKPYISSDKRFHRTSPLRWTNVTRGYSGVLYVSAANGEPHEVGNTIEWGAEWDTEPATAADDIAGYTFGPREFSIEFHITKAATVSVAGNSASMPLLRLPDGDVMEN